MKQYFGKIMAAAACSVFMGLSTFSAFAGEPGWQQENGVWHYYQPDGSLLVSAITPDGYLVDQNGVWEQKTFSILNQPVTAPDRFRTASQMGDWSGILTQLNEINSQIQSVLGGKRAFHVYGDSIEYCRVDGNTETRLMGLYQNTQTGGYNLRLSLNLGKRDNDPTKASTYDYQVFLYFCTLISSDPATVADAIYCSWQAGNEYGLRQDIAIPIGDAMIHYDAENGAGNYGIYARQPDAV